MNTGKWIKRPQNEQDMLQKQCKCSVKDIAHMLYCPLSPTPDSMEENPVFKANREQINKIVDSIELTDKPTFTTTDSWETRFDERFVFVDHDGTKIVGLYCKESKVIEYWQDYVIKKFISEVRQKAYDDGFEKGRAHGEEQEIQAIAINVTGDMNKPRKIEVFLTLHNSFKTILFKPIVNLLHDSFGYRYIGFLKDKDIEL